jgi:uridine kinase
LARLPVEKSSSDDHPGAALDEPVDGVRADEAAHRRRWDVVRVIGVAGGTGSGKTTVAHKLAAAMPVGACVLIEHDAYYRDQSHLSGAERDAINYDHPSSLESSLLAEHLRLLRAGHDVDLPIYDFVHHNRKVERRHVEPAPVIIVEGILVFVEPALREQMDIKIFVDTDADIRLMRRIRRDIEQRGRSFQSVRDQYYATVRPMHLEFVEPSKRWADRASSPRAVTTGGAGAVALDVLLGQLGRVALLRPQCHSGWLTCATPPSSAAVVSARAYCSSRWSVWRSAHSSRPAGRAVAAITVAWMRQRLPDSGGDGRHTSGLKVSSVPAITSSRAGESSTAGRPAVDRAGAISDTRL